MPAYSPGKVLLGKYRIEKFIGAGRFSMVYLARDLRKNSPYAVKVIHNQEAGVDHLIFSQYKKRFELETRLGAQVRSPYLIKIENFEQEDEALFLVMEYAPGGSLDERLSQAIEGHQPMQVADALRIGFEISQGLAVLHEHGVVHRAVKPDNILFGEDGKASLSDLGLAQVEEDHVPARHKHKGKKPPPSLRYAGTPAFNSPEQRKSLTNLAPSSDVYSLGVVLFLALTLLNPKHLPPGARLRKYRPDIQTDIDSLLAEMLDPDPACRPANGAEVAKRLESYTPPLQRVHSLKEGTIVNVPETVMMAEPLVYTLQREDPHLLSELKKLTQPIFILQKKEEPLINRPTGASSQSHKQPLSPLLRRWVLLGLAGLAVLIVSILLSLNP